MDWNSGFSALYEMKVVNPVSWMDAGSLDLTGGTVTKKTSSNLIESARIQMTEQIRECWVRVYLKAKQTRSIDRVPIFTGLAIAPKRELDGVRENYNVECYSVLKPAQDTLTPRGYYIPAGAGGAEIAAELLKVGPAPVTYEEHGPTLTEAIVSEDKDTNLTLALKALNAIGWRIRIAGDGTIHICSPADESRALYDAYDHDAVEPKVTDSDDWYSCPNCIRVVSGSNTVEIKDEDPASPLSTVSRKTYRGGTGEIWKQEIVTSLSSGESLSEYAQRKLKEAQAHARSISYTRRFNPDLTVSDIVTLHYPRQGIDGDFRITEQTITLGYGASTSEKVVDK